MVLAEAQRLEGILPINGNKTLDALVLLQTLLVQILMFIFQVQ